MRGYRALPPGGQRHRWRLAVAIAAPALLLVGSLGVAAYAELRPGRVMLLQAGVGCFEAPSLRADVAVVDLKGMTPIEQCRQVWAQDGFRRGRIDGFLDRLSGRAQEAPPLIVCVYPSGALAVLPGEGPEVCGQVGLREPAPGEIARLQRFDTFKNEVISRWFATSECPDPEIARNGIERLLKAYRLNDWRVATLDEIEPNAEKFNGTRPCALLDIRNDQKVIVLEPDVRPKRGLGSP